MSESIRVSAVLPTSPQRIYKAWLSSQEHSAMTGGQATVDPKVGGWHSAWDSYIKGVTLELEPGRRIVQSWRTSEFPADAPASRLEVLLEKAKGGTQITLNHSDIPDGQGAGYQGGWVESYFNPMRAYFTKKAPAKRVASKKAAPKPAAPKRAKSRVRAKHPKKGKRGVSIRKR